MGILAAGRARACRPPTATSSAAWAIRKCEVYLAGPAVAAASAVARPHRRTAGRSCERGDKMKLQGNVCKYGDNVDTDVIIPARYLNTSDPAELAPALHGGPGPRLRAAASGRATSSWRTRTSAAAPRASTRPLAHQGRRRILRHRQASSPGSSTATPSTSACRSWSAPEAVDEHRGRRPPARGPGTARSEPHDGKTFTRRRVRRSCRRSSQRRSDDVRQKQLALR